MGAKSNIAVGVAGGYLLGRTRKLKLALTLGGMLAGKRIAGVQDDLRRQGSELVEKNPDLAKLQQGSGQLVGAAKAAALTMATHRLHTLSDTLRGGQPGPGTEDAEEPDRDEAPTDEADTDEAPTDEADTDEAGTDEAGTDEAGTEEEGEDSGSDQPDSGGEDAPTSRTPQKRGQTAGKGAQKTAPKGTKKTAKKAAKKSTGTNRRSSGR